MWPSELAWSNTWTWTSRKAVRPFSQQQLLIWSATYIILGAYFAYSRIIVLYHKTIMLRLHAT